MVSPFPQKLEGSLQIGNNSTCLASTSVCARHFLCIALVLPGTGWCCRGFCDPLGLPDFQMGDTQVHVVLTAFACQLLVSGEMGLSHRPSLPFFQKGLSLHVTPEPQMGMGVYSEVEHQSVKPQAAQKRLSAHRGSAVGGKRRDAAEGEAQPSLQPLNEATVSANSSFLCMGWGWSGSPCLPHGDAVEASTKGDHPVRVYQVCLPVVISSPGPVHQVRPGSPAQN